MGRKTVISVVLLLLASYALPAMAAVSAPATPFCCRANGKHHCGMDGQSQSDRSFQSPLRCPYRAPASFTAHAQSFAPPASKALIAPLISPARKFVLTAIPADRIATYDIDQRGPPSLSL